jgi:hypothetical protein
MASFLSRRALVHSSADLRKDLGWDPDGDGAGRYRLRNDTTGSNHGVLADLDACKERHIRADPTTATQPDSPRGRMPLINDWPARIRESVISVVDVHAGAYEHVILDNDSRSLVIGVRE